MNLPFRIAWRYLFSKKSTNAINIISGISMLGMLVGACTLVVLLSVFNGFEGLVLSLYNVFQPDIEVRVAEGKTFEVDDAKIEQLRNLEGIERFSFTLEENAYFKYDENQYIGTIKGVDEQYARINNIDSFVVYGDYLLQDGDKHYAILGAGIEHALNVSYQNAIRPITILVPKRGKRTYILPQDAFYQSFVYPAGIFQVQQDFDTKYILTSLTFVQNLLKSENRISAIEIKVNPQSTLKEVKEEVTQIMGSEFVVKNKYEQQAVLYQVMKMEKWAVYAILSFIMFIISFNILGSLSMLVMEKKKDISILSAMGADKSMIRNIFLSEGIFLSFIGGLIGILIGAIICGVQQVFGIVPIPNSGSFIIDAYPVKMQLLDFVLIIITVIVISIFSSWIPSKRSVMVEKVFREG